MSISPTFRQFFLWKGKDGDPDEYNTSQKRKTFMDVITLASKMYRLSVSEIDDIIDIQKLMHLTDRLIRLCGLTYDQAVYGAIRIYSKWKATLDRDNNQVLISIFQSKFPRDDHTKLMTDTVETVQNLFSSIKILILWRILDICETLEREGTRPCSHFFSEEQVVVLFMVWREINKWCLNPTVPENLNPTVPENLHTPRGIFLPELVNNVPLEFRYIDGTLCLSLVNRRFDPHNLLKYNLYDKELLVIFLFLYLSSMIQTRYKMQSLQPSEEMPLENFIPPIIYRIFSALITCRGIAGTENEIYKYLDKNHLELNFYKKKKQTGVTVKYNKPLGAST